MYTGDDAEALTQPNTAQTQLPSRSVRLDQLHVPHVVSTPLSSSVELYKRRHQSNKSTSNIGLKLRIVRSLNVTDGRTVRTDTGRQQRPRLPIASYGKNNVPNPLSLSLHFIILFAI